MSKGVKIKQCNIKCRLHGYLIYIIQSDMKETLLEEKQINEELKSNLEIQKKLLEEMKDYFEIKNKK